MPKQPSLAEAVHQAAQTEPPPRTPAIKPKRLILRLPPDLYQLPIDNDTSMQALGVEALSELLGRHGS